jgi:hypothetical protein
MREKRIVKGNLGFLILSLIAYIGHINKNKKEEHSDKHILFARDMLIS